MVFRLLRSLIFSRYLLALLFAHAGCVRHADGVRIQGLGVAVYMKHRLENNITNINKSNAVGEDRKVSCGLILTERECEGQHGDQCYCAGSSYWCECAPIPRTESEKRFEQSVLYWENLKQRRYAVLRVTDPDVIQESYHNNYKYGAPLLRAFSSTEDHDITVIKWMVSLGIVMASFVFTAPVSGGIVAAIGITWTSLQSLEEWRNVEDLCHGGYILFRALIVNGLTFATGIPVVEGSVAMDAWGLTAGTAATTMGQAVGVIDVGEEAIQEYTKRHTLNENDTDWFSFRFRCPEATLKANWWRDGSAQIDFVHPQNEHCYPGYKCAADCNRLQGCAWHTLNKTSAILSGVCVDDELLSSFSHAH